MQLYAVVKIWDHKGQTKVEVPFCSDDIMAVQEERKRLLVNRPAGMVIASVEVKNCQLTRAGMAEVSDNYTYELLRTSVLYRLQERYPGLDETSIEMQKLIDALTGQATELYPGGGIDEEESLNKAFDALKDDIARVCEEDD